MNNLLAEFWETSDYSKQAYEMEPLTAEHIAAVEKALARKLPRAYVELMRTQNGGIPTRTCYRTRQKTSWADDHIAIAGLYGIGASKPNALCGEFGTQFWIVEWGYPPIGVYFADCPSAGHDMLCLDYSAKGPDEEPRVVHVDQERDYRITVLAETFEAFMLGLEDDGNFTVK